jgi:hypothetical protein
MQAISLERSRKNYIYIKNVACRTICYQTLRSAYMEAVKWRFSRYSAHSLQPDAERTSHYFYYIDRGLSVHDYY